MPRLTLTQDDSALRNHVRREVIKAVGKGELIRQPCEYCGEERGQAHHDDYAKPMEVRWLCKRCHIFAHFGDSYSKAEERKRLHNRFIASGGQLMFRINIWYGEGEPSSTFGKVV